MIVLTRSETDSTFLIIYGCISAEIMGTWRGGRVNYNNSIVFKLKEGEALDRFLKEIDVKARAYEDGTRKNYDTLHEVIKSVFPPEATRYSETHMFHRIEISEIVDLRKP